MDSREKTLRAIISKNDIRGLCELGEEMGVEKVSSITIEIRMGGEGSEKDYACLEVDWIFDKKYPAQMKTLWNFFSSGLCE